MNENVQFTAKTHEINYLFIFCMIILLNVWAKIVESGRI